MAKVKQPSVPAKVVSAALGGLNPRRENMQTINQMLITFRQRIGHIVHKRTHRVQNGP